VRLTSFNKMDSFGWWHVMDAETGGIVAQSEVTAHGND
jgi:hypothetical protein